MPLLCYIVKYLFYIPPILVVWWRTTSHTVAFSIHFRALNVPSVAQEQNFAVLLLVMEVNFKVWQSV
jgi:hypothetical protein